MKQHIILLLLNLILISFVQAQSFKGVFALSWLSGFCNQEQQTHQEPCDSSLVALWDNQSHTIHGLWPDLSSTQTYGKFDITLFQDKLKLLDDMHNYWPPKVKASTDPTFLWKHQWEKHGYDYARILMQLRPEDFPGNQTIRNAALQVAYFQDTINFYKKLTVQKIRGKSFTGSQYAAAVGTTEKQLTFYCYKSNLMREVKFCFEITKSGFVLANCTKPSSSCSGGGATIELIDWAFKGQSRVFNYERTNQLISEA